MVHRGSALLCTPPRAPLSGASADTREEGGINGDAPHFERGIRPHRGHSMQQRIVQLTDAHTAPFW